MTFCLVIIRHQIRDHFVQDKGKPLLQWLLRRYLYCILLPFGLVDSIGIMTPLAVTFVSYTFFALEALSDEIENPFGLDANDLALDTMVASINASLREMLGEVPPPAPRPDANFVLT